MGFIMASYITVCMYVQSLHVIINVLLGIYRACCPVYKYNLQHAFTCAKLCNASIHT